MKKLENTCKDVRRPLIRVTEHDGAFVLDVEMPGIAESDVDLVVERGTLKLEASSEATKTMSYERFLQLPKTIDAGKLSATMSKGILSLTLPKVEELKPRTIKVLAS